MWRKYKRRVLLAMSSQAFAQLVRDSYLCLRGLMKQAHIEWNQWYVLHQFTQGGTRSTLLVISYYARESAVEAYILDILSHIKSSSCIRRCVSKLNMINTILKKTIFRGRLARPSSDPNDGDQFNCIRSKHPSTVRIILTSMEHS